MPIIAYHKERKLYLATRWKIELLLQPPPPPLIQSLIPTTWGQLHKYFYTIMRCHVTMLINFYNDNIFLASFLPRLSQSICTHFVLFNLSNITMPNMHMAISSWTCLSHLLIKIDVNIMAWPLIGRRIWKSRGRELGCTRREI